MAKKIIALHGLLGSPVDFKPLLLQGLIAPAIFSSMICPYPQWVRRFNGLLTDSSILMGYSMGGRLALHCLINRPELFKAAIIIAAHPGLKTAQEREKRLNYDYSWAHKFLHQPWPELMFEWNNTPALKTARAVRRYEHDFNRTTLAHCLRYFSLGHQEYLIPQLNQLNLPILWLSSMEERERCDEISFKHPQSQKIFFNEGGHRFMFESPLAVKNHIAHFLESI